VVVEFVSVADQNDEFVVVRVDLLRALPRQPLYYEVW